MKAAIVSLMALAGCAMQANGSTIVRDIKVVGHQLDVETCVLAGGEHATLKDCGHARIEMPVLTLPAPPAPPAPPATVMFTLDRAGVATLLAAARPALERCNSTSGNQEAVRVRLVIDGSGQVTAVEADTLNEPMRMCMTSVLATLQFTVPPAALTFTFKENQ